MLAHHFHAQIVLLHVMTAMSHAAGVPNPGREAANWDLLAVILREAETQQDHSLRPELDGVNIQRMLCKCDPAQAIVETAEAENAASAVVTCLRF